MEQTKTPWHAKLTLILAILLPVYFAVAALGTKFGFWSWQVGLGTLIIGAAPMLLGIVAALAVISLILILRKAPRKAWVIPLVALAIPAGIFAYLGTVGSTADANPIYDVATDAANPPTFSEAKMAARTESEANPVSDYATPLGQVEWWADRSSEELKAKSLGQLMGELYPDLEPIAIGDTGKAEALAAIEGGMQDIKLSNITVNTQAGTVEGVAETFWFGFKDDVVARVSDGEIDFRSVSRVGVSDLGANSQRIEKLRMVVQSRLNE